VAQIPSTAEIKTVGKVMHQIRFGKISWVVHQ